MKVLPPLLVTLLVLLTAVGAGLSVGGVDAGSPSPAVGLPTTAGERPDAGTTAAQVDRPPSPPRTVNALGIRTDAANRSEFATTYVDLGPALGVEAAATSHRLETLRSVERVETAESDAERTARLRAEVRTLENRTDALGRTQGRALSRYVEGRYTSEELLTDLVAVDREARALDDRSRRLWRIANRTDAPIPDERFAALDRELGAYHGPVRARAAAALTGEAGSVRCYVAATPRGVVLATLTEDTYLREVYRADLRRVGDAEMNASAAADVVAAGYPDVWEARHRAAAEGGRVARVAVDYRGGRLETLIGSGNGRVFADEHRRSLDGTGTNETAVNTRDGLRMTVNRSYAGGAMHLELRDTAGTPVNASVTIGPAGGQSVTVGHTGDDGELWVLTPDERFTLVAIRDQSVVFLTMSPLETPEPGADGG